MIFILTGLNKKAINFTLFAAPVEKVLTNASYKTLNNFQKEYASVILMIIMSY
jgi:hypothetical protein